MLDAANWFASLDALRLECDGMTRVISALLQRDNIPHSPMVGSLTVDSVGRIPVHHWIALADGQRIDLRARMWLHHDPRVPHGLVPAQVAGVKYQGHGYSLSCSPVVFWALTDAMIDAFAPATFLASTIAPTLPTDGATALAREA